MTLRCVPQTAVVSQDWDDLWYDLYHPTPNPTKEQLTEVGIWTSSSPTSVGLGVEGRGGARLGGAGRGEARWDGAGRGEARWG